MTDDAVNYKTVIIASLRQLEKLKLDNFIVESFGIKAQSKGI